LCCFRNTLPGTFLLYLFTGNWKKISAAIVKRLNRVQGK
jgi:hypothetical protein